MSQARHTYLTNHNHRHRARAAWRSDPCRPHSGPAVSNWPSGPAQDFAGQYCQARERARLALNTHLAARCQSDWP